MQTLYLKRVINNGIRFVMVYNNEEGTDLKSMFNSTITSLPNKRRKILTLNCFKFNIKWIN